MAIIEKNIASNFSSSSSPSHQAEKPDEVVSARRGRGGEEGLPGGFSGAEGAAEDGGRHRRSGEKRRREAKKRRRAGKKNESKVKGEIF